MRLTVCCKKRLIKWVLFLLLPFLAVTIKPSLAVALPGEPPTPEVFADISELGKGSIPVVQLCNCWQYVYATLGGIPSSSYVLSHLTSEGSVVAFYYPSSDLYHYAIVNTSDDERILVDETNYHSCRHSYRWVSKDDPSILGYYQP